VNTWKLLGLAGLAGVAATGAVVARDERRRRAVTPDDVRARLHERLEQAAPEPAAVPVAQVPRGLAARLRRRRRRTSPAS
jgi:hypothetical protein